MFFFLTSSLTDTTTQWYTVEKAYHIQNVFDKEKKEKTNTIQAH